MNIVNTGAHSSYSDRRFYYKCTTDHMSDNVTLGENQGIRVNNEMLCDTSQAVLVFPLPLYVAAFFFAFLGRRPSPLEVVLIAEDFEVCRVKRF